MMELAQRLLEALGLFVAIGGVALSVPHLARSKWVTVIAGAFAVEASVLCFYLVSALLMRNAVLTYETMRVALLGVSLVHVAARAALVAGIVGVVSALPRPAQVPAPPPTPVELFRS